MGKCARGERFGRKFRARGGSSASSTSTVGRKQFSLRSTMDGGGINESEIFDIIFGGGGKSNHNNNVMEAVAASNSPMYSSAVSEPGTANYMIERWEPGEIVDHDHEMGSCSSTSSLANSPNRPYALQRHPHRPIRISVSFNNFK